MAWFGHGDQDFFGSAIQSLTELDPPGTLSATSLSWDNGSFNDQHAVEAAADYVGLLDNPAATGVIGVDGNTTTATVDIHGTSSKMHFLHKAWHFFTDLACVCCI